jgi:hypothetical protein
MAIIVDSGSTNKYFHYMGINEEFALLH